MRGRDCPRVFVTDPTGTWSELTAGGRPVVWLSAQDLQEAQRRRRRLPPMYP